jgi:hypothetical protein
MPRQSGTLGSHRVLAHLYQHRLPRLEHVLDTAVCRRAGIGIPVNLAGIQHRVATTADIHERGFHAGQHILHLAQVDVADQRCGRLAIHVVLHEHAILKDTHLGVIRTLPHHHQAVDGLPASQELSLAQDGRAPPTGRPALSAALPLGFQTGGALDPGNLVRAADGPGFADLHQYAGLLSRDAFFPMTPTPAPTVVNHLSLTGHLRLNG